MRNVSENFAETFNTKVLCQATFSENRVVYEIMWRNVVETDRKHVTVYYGACALRVGQLRLQTHTQNMSLLLLF